MQRMAWLDRLLLVTVSASLAGGLTACDTEKDDVDSMDALSEDEDAGEEEGPGKEEEPGEDDEPADDEPADDDEPDSELEACEDQGESRACEGSGTQYCDDIEGALAWGPCVTEPQCEPGDSESCGLCGEDEEDCEFAGFDDTCVLADGVPAWGCSVAEDFDSCACNTPLVLKFDAAPVQMMQSASATFDIDGVGACVTTDWPTADTPWLALDLDLDGTIDSGRELFGSGTRLDGARRARNGFLALEPLDTDRNGRIDARDERFSELVLWSDHDGDKRGTLAEMEPLSMRSVLSIDLGYTIDRQCDDRGNCGVERSAFTFVDSTGNIAKGEVVDLHLACQ